MDHENGGFFLSAHMESPRDLKLPKKRKYGLSNLQIISGSPSMSLNFTPSRIFWHSVRETSETTRAVYQILDGKDGPIILDISLAPGESTRDWFSEPGLTALSSIYLKVVSGTIEGVISSCSEADYQAGYSQVEIMNFPGFPILVDDQAVKG
jgi:hypothetical protein